ncbi:MAG: hypothetical protein J6Y48_02495 [Clostridia bacterium]|nr:hypothetical protein [Clostridia bacterium]
MEKSEIFPPLPQPGDDGGDVEERRNNYRKGIEDKGFQRNTAGVEKEIQIGYNQAAEGKEWQSKQGSMATCSGLTK